ncbi:MAG: SprB repeat-containing protein, partial [Bacteroidales bacterium]|nr:SprB repeat-containing protein [Bacteroidales bacterium]
MKTLYLKTTMKLIRLLPVLIFFMLALSYNARSQFASPNPVCYGQPIYLFCSLSGCEVAGATYTWTNVSGSWISTDQNPIILPFTTGYAEDRFFLQVQFAPPPGGFSGGTVKVNLLPGVSVTGTATNILCYGLSTGSINITATGGNPPYTYLWSNGSVSKNQTGLAAGTYSVTVTDLSGCFNDTQSWTITQPSDLILTGVVSPVLCNGASTGSVDISVSGGTPGYGYLWSNGAVTQDIINLAAGVYTVTVSDANNCKKINSYTVTQSSAIILTGTPSPVLCNGGSSGSVDISVSGGVTPYGYLWSNGAVTEDISGLTAGTYTVTVTDANSCTTSNSWTVTQPSALSLTGTASPVLCFGGSTGAVDITVSGGTMPYGYMWSTGAITEDISGLTAGFYTVTVTDGNACTMMMSYEVTGPVAALNATASVTNIDCNGNHNGTINLTVTGGTPAYAYEWSNGSVTEDLTGLYPGTYTVTVTDANACFTTGSWMISEPSDISWYGSVTNVSCYGGSDGHIEGGADGGTPPYTYQWSTGATTQNIANLTAGTYTVTATDAVGCYTFTSRIIGQPSELVIAQQAVITDVSCNGGSDGAIDISVSGGTPAYTYMWSNGETSEDIGGLVAGMYVVTVTDANGCQNSAYWMVNEPAALSLTGQASPVLCNGGSTGSINISVSGGTPAYGYMWSNGAMTEDITGLTAGVYTVTITDANGCKISDFWTVAEPSALSLTGTATPALCNGGSSGTIDISVSGGTMPYGYLWSNGTMSEDVSGLAAGFYTVTVTDDNGCQISDTWQVTEPSALSLTGMASPVLCNGGSTGSVDITVTGGTMPYGYIWSNGESSEDISGLTAGTYSVVVTDANGCQIFDYWMVTEPSALSLTGTSTPVLCYGGTTGTIDITVSGGTMPYGYLWSNGAMTEDLSGLTGGVYTVTVTDGNACMITLDFTVSGPQEALLATAVVTNIDCNGNHNGTIDLTVSGGTPAYGYEWSNGAITEDLSGLFPGTYTVTVTDANACITTGSWMVSEPSDISWYGSVTNVSCYGGSDGFIEGSALGGTPPYTYLWSNGETTENIYNLTAGTYTVTPTDAAGCYTFTSRVIGQPFELLISQGTIVTNVSCFGGSNGAIDITVTGGTMPYGYMWSNSDTTEDISGLNAGIYNVTVTDAHGCQTYGECNVEEAPALTLTGTPTPVLCNGGSSGSIDIMVAGGTMPYGYAW